MQLICEAIRTRRLLEFQYKDKKRIVAPYCHGTSTAGNEVLRAVELSASGAAVFGKLWKVSELVGLRLGQSFEPNDPNYNPNDSAMSHVHCRI